MNYNEKEINTELIKGDTEAIEGRVSTLNKLKKTLCPSHFLCALCVKTMQQER
jgi:hypothetical protein